MAVCFVNLWYSQFTSSEWRVELCEALALLVRHPNRSCEPCKSASISSLLSLLDRQNVLSIFTQANPAGDVTSREEYKRFLVMLIFVGAAVSVKRVCLGYYFGQRISARYSDDLHELLEKLLLLSEIATLSFAPRQVRSELNVSIDVASQQSTDQTGKKSQNTVDNVEASHHFQKLLEEWDEPTLTASSENVRIKMFTRLQLPLQQLLTLWK